MSENLDLCKLIEQFGSEEKCREYLEALRWPDNVTCPRCLSDKISRVYGRDQFDCDSCRYQFSVTAGTMLADSHLPLWKWFLATYLICESRKGMSANQISRTLGITYKTSWYLCHRIRAAMLDVPHKLNGTVEMDETYVGGRKIGKGVKAGRDNKEVVIGIRERGGDLRLFHASDAKAGTLAKYIQEHISEYVDVIVTDEFAAYPFAMQRTGMSSKHKTIRHKDRQYVTDNGMTHTNTVESAFSLLKRGIVGTWHRLSAKHLQAYLQEMMWRFDNRENPYLFRDTLMKMLGAQHLEYKELTA